MTKDTAEISPTTEQSKIVPQTYGEAIQQYPFIDCKGHEWDNRTTFENAIYLVEQYQSQLTAIAEEVDAEIYTSGNNGNTEEFIRGYNEACKKALEIINTHIE